MSHGIVNPVVALNALPACRCPFMQVLRKIIEQNHLHRQAVQAELLLHEVGLLYSAWYKQAAVLRNFREIFVHPLLLVLQG